MDVIKALWNFPYFPPWRAPLPEFFARINMPRFKPSALSRVNQASKAMALAKGYLKEDCNDIVFFKHEFVDVEIDGKVRTAIMFIVEAR
jgi:hypothetical protein